MKVLKFGGTSVGSAQRMKDVAKLICDGEQKIVRTFCHVRNNEHPGRNIGLSV